MRITRCTVAKVAALVGLLASSTAGWAQTAVEERAAQRVKAEKQVAQLQEKAAAVQTTGKIGEAHVKIANQLLEAAQKALDSNNERTATVLAAQAEHMLKLAATAKEVQQ